ncbi:hypothetical protein EDS67_11010 [candidate division KSB1 bacterium]|nr:MAG: hypothetical protein EDS67_11010 [candidate division KSB1 bacterium]MBC6950098.1 hypothetical protein [candidate division KSB1 bacterium]MCE7942007.1 hypothetical protein [Chlorobi bacterium CHB1]MDL1879212.1 hypothetical protein [Cytophagia bacterium CHB2]
MDESTQQISFPAFAGRTFQVELYTPMKLIEQWRQPRPQKLHPKTKALTKMNDGPATITFFVELFQSSRGHGCFPRVRCARPSALLLNAFGVFVRPTQNSIEPII